jgi:hypothetical protein
MNADAKRFQEFRNAQSWALTHARDHCHPHHFWRIEQVDDQFVVAIRSRNTSALHHYATAE